jgi:hypothetical protein
LIQAVTDGLVGTSSRMIIFIIDIFKRFCEKKQDRWCRIPLNHDHDTDAQPMKLMDKLNSGEILKGLFLAQLIILFHVLIIAVLGIMVLILGGLARNLIWIILGSVAVTLILTYIVYRRVKTQGSDMLRDLNRSGAMRDRPLEISVMGGLMSLKIGSSDSLTSLESNRNGPIPQLEDAESIRKRELTDLAQLLADDLISTEEYTLAKHKILSG